MLASSEIAVRYFRWATTEWRRIHDGDFTELLQTGMRAAEQCVAALRQLGVEQRIETITALTKRGHPTACKALHSPLTRREESLLQQLDTMHRLWANAHVSPRGVPANERRGWVAGIQERVAGAGPIEKRSKLAWTHSMPVGNWTLKTHVDLSGQWGDLYYLQELWVGAAPVLEHLISYLAWLGISPSKWTPTSLEEANAAAETVSRLALHFANAVPELTRGVEAAC